MMSLDTDVINNSVCYSPAARIMCVSKTSLDTGGEKCPPSTRFPIVGFESHRFSIQENSIRAVLFSQDTAVFINSFNKHITICIMLPQCADGQPYECQSRPRI